MTPLERVLEKLEGVTKTPNGFTALCPGHPDTTASLSGAKATDGKVLLTCFAGCTVEAIVAAIGLTMADLFPEKPETPEKAKKAKGKIVATYDYTDAEDVVLFQSVRYEPKDFKQRRPTGNGEWTWNIVGVIRVLFHLRKLLAAPNGSTIVIPEGEKDVLTVERLGHLATTNVGGAGKWNDSYSKVLAGHHVVILEDNDDAGRKHAAMVAASAIRGGAASVRIIGFPDLPEKGDVSDWIAAGGTREALDALIASTPPTAVGDPAQPLDALLDDIVAFVQRFMVLELTAIHAVALWIVHTYVLDAFDITPYLNIHSPSKRCAKSRLLEVIGLLVTNTWKAIAPTEAVLFRKIDADRPVLLLDEIDAMFKSTDGRHEPMRAVLNAGYQRGTKVPRCVGPDFEVKEFDPFCAKALSGIGQLPDTINDRSIGIRMKRCMPAEKRMVKRLRLSRPPADAAPLREALSRWATSTIVKELRVADPILPATLNDRAADIWEPLFAIADMAGDTWSKRARTAATTLHGVENAGSDELGAQTLMAIRDIFDATNKSTELLSTVAILTALVDRDDGPWASWWGADVAAGRTQGIAQKLAKILKPYDIQSTTIQVGEEKPCKGYKRADFEDAWARYGHTEDTADDPKNLDPLPDSVPAVVRPLNPLVDVGLPAKSSRYTDTPVTAMNDPQTVAAQRFQRPNGYDRAKHEGAHISPDALLNTLTPEDLARLGADAAAGDRLAAAFLAQGRA